MENIDEFLSERKTKSEINEYKASIAEYLKENFIPPTTAKKEQFEDWFDGYLKNYVFNQRIDLKNQDFRDDLMHKVDYLNSAQAKKRFDRMTWDVLEKQVSQWESWLTKRAELGDDPEGTRLECQLSDNWSAVELMSSKALSYEGGTMGHCVGSYHDKVHSGRVKIFSLRDKKDKSHITVEYNLGSQEIVQIQGKENKLPKESYNKYIFEFAKERKLMFSSSMMHKFGFKQLGYSYLPPGKEYQEKLVEVLSMGENYKEGGVLDLTGEDCQGMPISGQWDIIKINKDNNIGGLENLSVESLEIFEGSGNLTFDNVKASRMRVASSLFASLEGIEISKELRISNSLIKEIPNYDLERLDYKGMESLPVLKKCDANAFSLKIENAPFLTEIKKGNYDNLELNRTGLKSLDGVSAHKLVLHDAPDIKNIDFDNVNSVDCYNVGIEEFKSVHLEDKGKFSFSCCSNLKKVSDIKGSSHRLSLMNNESLEEISGVSVAFLELRGNKGLKKLEKIRAHSANFSDVDFKEVEARRINLRKIDTNNPEILRTRKLSSLYRPK